MSERIILDAADEVGPEAIVYVYDPESGMKGLLVVDSTAAGTAGGGIRMLPDITAEEIFWLARAMTNKFAIYDLPRGGCKAGIWGDPMVPGVRKDAIMRAFGRALKPYLESRTVSLATDMGVTGANLELVYEGAEMSPPGKGLSSQEKDGEPLEYHLTGFGVVCAMKAACKIAGIDLCGARIAIEGFGKVGGGVLRYSAKEGAKIVSISTVHEAIYNEDGLNIEELLELRKQLGDECLSQYNGASHIANADIYFLPVDILVPGARPFVLTKDNVYKVKAKIISSGANIPVTREAEKIFFEEGGLGVPDFIANAGGTISAMVNYLGGSAEQAFGAINNLISRVTTEVLIESSEKKIDPYTIALEKCEQRVLKARSQTKKLSFQETMQEIKGRLGVF